MHIEPPVHPASIKSAAQLRIMRDNARLLFRLFSGLKPFMVAGSTGVRIQEFCLAFFRQQGLRVVLQGYRNFPAQICVARNEVVAHGLPDLVPLRAGDLVTIDVAASRLGFCADAAWTYLIPGGEAAPRSLWLCAWQASLAGARAGGEARRRSAIGQTVHQLVGQRGFAVLPRFAGHGIGRHLHEAPQVLFLPNRPADDALPAGLVVNVEPIVATRPEEPRLLADGWSWALPAGNISAQFEFSLAVLPDGAWELLNFADPGLIQSSEPPF